MAKKAPVKKAAKKSAKKASKPEKVNKPSRDKKSPKAAKDTVEEPKTAPRARKSEKKGVITSREQEVFTRLREMNPKRETNSNAPEAKIPEQEQHVFNQIKAMQNNRERREKITPGQNEVERNISIHKNKKYFRPKK